MTHSSRIVAGLVALGVTAGTSAAETTTTLHRITADGIGTAVGTLSFVDSGHGLIVQPDLRGLSDSGAHGTHIHTHPDCGARTMQGMTHVGGAAGGHYDPEQTGEHAGPYGAGHLGDLPNLHVERDGRATLPVLAPRLRVDDVTGRAVMVHAAADRYHDHDGHHHGKGGMRMYCGVIEKS